MGLFLRLQSEYKPHIQCKFMHLEMHKLSVIKINILLFTVSDHKLYHCNVEHYQFLAFYLISVVFAHCRSKRFPKYRSIMQSLKRRLSFRKKKDHVPECSKPHQWQEDEKKVREGTCSFQVRVSRFTFPLLLALLF